MLRLKYDHSLKHMPIVVPVDGVEKRGAHINWPMGVRD